MMKLDLPFVVGWFDQHEFDDEETMLMILPAAVNSDLRDAVYSRSCCTGRRARAFRRRLGLWTFA
jgi:hypothetical protein